MQKLILVSILLMTVAIPAVAARERRPELGARKVVWWMLVGITGYVLALAFAYPRFGP